jgi:nickel-dependent lactate racemase
MQISLAYGRTRCVVEVDVERLIPLERADPPSPLDDPIQAVRDALETPLRFPALRCALTPDDHVAIVVDEHLPRLPEMIAAVVEHIVSTGVAPSAISLVCPPSTFRQTWLEDLPEAVEDVHLEVHDPSDRNHLAYLATTRGGRRVYLNRTAVDADQLVLLTGRRFDARGDYAGGESALFPALSDQSTRDAKGTASDKSEVLWLLGAPFLIQVVEGGGDTIVQVIGGTSDTVNEGRQWLDRSWRATAAGPADVVIATISGDPARQDMADMARALACAAKLVRPGGVVALLCETAPDLGEAFQLLQQYDEPEEARRHLRDAKLADQSVAREWLAAVRKAHVYLLSGLMEETAEALFTAPLQHARQVQRLLEGGGQCLVLPDAHRLQVDVATS